MEWERIHFEVIGSTNTWGKENAPSLPRDRITLVTAGEQTAGRGRFKRRWESPPGQNIYATYCFFVEKHQGNIGNIPQILALSAAATLQAAGFEPVLKWPNDVLLSGKKVAGILAETTPLSDTLCAIIGIGLNVNMPKELLAAIDRPATSLLAESGRAHDVESLLDDLTRHFSSSLDLFFEEGFHPFLEPYKKLMPCDPAKTVKFHDNRTIWEGTVHGINPDGSLLFQLPDGTLKTFVAGEILWL